MPGPQRHGTDDELAEQYGLGAPHPAAQAHDDELAETYGLGHAAPSSGTGVTELGTIHIQAGTDEPGPREGMPGDTEFRTTDAGMRAGDPEAFRVAGRPDPRYGRAGPDTAGLAGVHAFANNALLGFDDELGAAVGSLMGRGNYDQLRQRAESDRNSSIQQAENGDDLVSKAARYIGAAGGMGLTMAAPVGDAMRALGATGRLANAAATGAAVMGAQGVGNAHGVGGRIAGGLAGMAGGAAGGAGSVAAGQLLGRGVDALSRGLGRGADLGRLAAAGAGAGDMMAVHKTFPGGVRGMADTMRANGLTSMIGRPQSFIEPAERLAAEGSGTAQQVGQRVADWGRRAEARTAAAPPLGFREIMGGAAGFFGGGTGGLAGGVAAARATRAISPRLTSVTATAAERLSSALSHRPQSLGAFGPVLQRIAAEKGAEAANAYHFVLMRTNPSYRQMFNDDNSGGQAEEGNPAEPEENGRIED